jgi:hypothetical protein
MTSTRTAAPLARLLDDRASLTRDLALERFLDHVAGEGLTLYPAQEEALLEIFAGKNVVLATPTGSGKSLVAEAMCFAAMADGARAFYTFPIKALVSEKFFSLCRLFGPDDVGMITGDARVNPDAPIICCTAEILANTALRHGEDAPVDVVIMDEFHYYADRDRGVAWQIPLLALSRCRFLLMSATMGAPERFAELLTAKTNRPTAVVRSSERPVPLTFDYAESPLHETVASLVARGRHPIYIVAFTQRACAEEAQNLMSVDLCTKDEKRAIAESLAEFRFDSPYGKEIARFVRHGIGVHHAGLLPKYRLLVEKLAQAGKLKIICGTDTLGVGVNIPIRTVLFTKLCKYDGEKTSILSAREFHQIAGRAGRKGFDNEGFVVAQAPEHVIENLRLEAKAGSDPQKKKKIVKKRPPEFGYVHWDRGTFDKLQASPPEPLVSRFSVSHGMLLQVLQRPTGGCRSMIRLVKESHESPAQKQAHGKRGRLLYRALLDAGVVEVAADDAGRRRLRVNLELQDDFSLHQSLGLWLLDTLPVLDRQSVDFPLDLLTLCESIVEDPDLILQKQLDKLKGETVARLKAEGVEYDQRMAELEKLEYPKPLRDFIYDTFNEYAKRHPWVGENIRPKSVAREMYETFQGFSEYVKSYDLQRAEGLLLRYLSDVYKVLVQNVPEAERTEAIDEMIVYFRELIRRVDASLIEEWEKLRHPEDVLAELTGSSPSLRRFDEKAFMVRVRNAIFALLRAIAVRDFETAAGLLDGGDEETGEPWTKERLELATSAYFEEHGTLRTDAAARAPRLLRKLDEPESARQWRLEQTLLDPDEHADFVLVARVDLERSMSEDRVVLMLDRIGR